MKYLVGTVFVFIQILHALCAAHPTDTKTNQDSTKNEGNHNCLGTSNLEINNNMGFLNTNSYPLPYLNPSFQFPYFDQILYQYQQLQQQVELNRQYMALIENFQREQALQGLLNITPLTTVSQSVIQPQSSEIQSKPINEYSPEICQYDDLTADYPSDEDPSENLVEGPQRKKVKFSDPLEIQPEVTDSIFNYSSSSNSRFESETDSNNLTTVLLPIGSTSFQPQLNIIGSNRCGMCFVYGHNARRCPQNERNAPQSQYFNARARKCTNYCGICHNPGHNRRTCPQKNLCNQHPQ